VFSEVYVIVIQPGCSAVVNYSPGTASSMAHKSQTIGTCWICCTACCSYYLYSKSDKWRL